MVKSNTMPWLISAIECERRMFTKPLTLMDGVISDHHAYELMHSIRWPRPLDMDCPECAKVSCLHFKLGDGRMKCNGCGCKFSISTGTFIHSTKLSCAIWYRFSYLVARKKIFSTTKVSRDLGVSINTVALMFRSLSCAVNAHGSFCVSRLPDNINSEEQCLKLLLRKDTNPLRKKVRG